MKNAMEFISAYNEIDTRLRSLYKGKGNLQFVDLIRRAAVSNRTVSRYEEELLSFARLRNAIVHGSTTERVIAEPCDEATAQIKHIAALLSRPPALSLLKEKKVTGISDDASLQDALMKAAKMGYSNLPVYHNGRIIGMLNNRRFVREIGRALEEGEDLKSILSRPCAAFLHDEDMTFYYKILGKNNTVQETVDLFEENRKLLAVIVTENGRIDGRIINLIVPSDLPKLIKLIS